MHRLIVPLSFALVGATPLAHAEASVAVPPSIQALLDKGDTVLAFQSSKPLGDIADGAALVVRHARTDPATGNPCELLLLRKTGTAFIVAASNRQAIDCRYNESAKAAGPMGLAHNLTVTATTVTYFNELARGGTTYGFTWDAEKHAWHLQHVEATSVENGADGAVVYKSVLDYPVTLPWLLFEDFSPKAIREAIRTHRAVVR